MTTAKRFANFRIELRERNHNPPHVHVVGPEFEAAVDLRTLAVTGGALPVRVLREALAGVEAHREELLEKWRVWHG